MESGYYPLGAEFDDNAPYNQEEQPDEEIEVTVSLSLSKTLKLKVNDYTVTKDSDDGVDYVVYDYSTCNFQEALESQVVLPNNLAAFTENIFEHDLDLKAAGMCMYLKDAIEDCKGWHLDELEIIKE